jgi:hypothetical protein
MKCPNLWLSLVCVLLLSASAQAEKLEARVSPKNQQSMGFSLSVEPRTGDMVGITVTRDLSKARTFDANSDLELRRSSILRVYGDSGLMVECPVTSDQRKNTVVYWFSVAKAQLANTHFTVMEIDDYKATELREHLIGGGTYFEFNLADFAAK